MRPSARRACESRFLVACDFFVFAPISRFLLRDVTCESCLYISRMRRCHVGGHLLHAGSKEQPQRRPVFSMPFFSSLLTASSAP